MTRNELVAAYQSGRISRRGFIRGMTALGLSTAVATAMADRLRAAPGGERSSARLAGADDTYETPIAGETETPTTTLPSTGVGDEPEGGAGWVKPAALLGAAAALIAGGIKKIKGETGTEEA